MVLSVGAFGLLFHEGEKGLEVRAGGSLAWAEQLRDDDSRASSPRELMKIIEDRMKQADEKERQAEEAQRQMELLKADIAERIEELRKERQELDKLAKSRKEKEDANLSLLAKSLAETPPEQAGVILGELEADLAASILKRMNNRKAGKIWGYINADKAAAISRSLANRSNGKEVVRPRTRRKPPKLLPPPLPLE
jgi:flagellar motility protein MotE (MotC chaperone)